MIRYLKIFSFIIFVASSSCTAVRKAHVTNDDGKIEVVFVQVNDVYEIAPVANGKQGGMARVATLKKQYRQKNNNTFLVMSGDFLSPSLYNSLRFNGKLVRGAQMVETMNAAGMDFVCFGNHEFDVTETELQERINESGFNWISANAFHKTKNGDEPFKRTSVANTSTIPASYVMTVKDKDGTSAKIGFIGVVLPSNPQDYVSYTDALSAAKQQYNLLKDSVDAVVAITHQDSSADKTLAGEIPQLAAILGGHEHVGYQTKIGDVYITKAKSNARTAYVVTMLIDKNKHTTSVTPKAVNIDDHIAFDGSTKKVVEKWSSIVDKSYASLGLNLKKVVIPSGEALDAREAVIYNRSSNLTVLVTKAMADACPQANVVMINSGSFRLDDLLTPPVTEYDIVRTLPYGGALREVDMKGSLLLQILDATQKNKFKGGWLQYQGVTYNEATDTYSINSQPIDVTKTYRVALTDFLLSGKEVNLDFLNQNNPGILKVYPAVTSINDPRSDIRLAIVQYLQKKNGRP